MSVSSIKPPAASSNASAGDIEAAKDREAKGAPKGSEDGKKDKAQGSDTKKQAAADAKALADRSGEIAKEGEKRLGAQVEKGDPEAAKKAEDAKTAKTKELIADSGKKDTRTATEEAAKKAALGN